jgi:cytochrome P450
LPRVARGSLRNPAPPFDAEARVHPDIYDPVFQEDPFATYAELRATQPVYREPRYGAFLLTRFEDVMAALRDHETFCSSAGPAPMPGNAGGGAVLAATDPPYHDQLRALVSRAFTPRRVAESAPRIESLARELVDALPEDGFDLVSALSIPLPVTVIAEMLGVPAERQPDFRRWSDAFVGLLESPPTPDLLAATGELVHYFGELAEERRRRPQDDLVSALLQAEIDGRRLTREELNGFFIMLLVAGNETTTNLISNQLHLLASRPDLWKELRENRAAVPAAIEETVRWDAPVQNLGREATRDVTLHGVTMPAGARIVVSFGAANPWRPLLPRRRSGTTRRSPGPRSLARPVRGDPPGPGRTGAPAIDRHSRLRSAAARHLAGMRLDATGERPSNVPRRRTTPREPATHHLAR